MLGGVGDHPLEPAAVSLLDVRATPDLRLGLPDADDERVPNPLELGHAEDARTSRGTHAPVDPLAGESARPELAQASLELADLAPQLGTCEPLVRRPDGRRRRRTGRKSKVVVLLERGWAHGLLGAACLTEQV